MRALIIAIAIAVNKESHQARQPYTYTYTIITNPRTFYKRASSVRRSCPSVPRDRDQHRSVAVNVNLDTALLSD